MLTGEDGKDSWRNMHSLRVYNKGYFAREDFLVSGNGNTLVYVMVECWRTSIPNLCRVGVMNTPAWVTKEFFNILNENFDSQVCIKWGLEALGTKEFGK